MEDGMYRGRNKNSKTCPTLFSISMKFDTAKGIFHVYNESIIFLIDHFIFYRINYYSLFT